MVGVAELLDRTGLKPGGSRLSRSTMLSHTSSSAATAGSGTSPRNACWCTPPARPTSPASPCAGWRASRPGRRPGWPAGDSGDRGPRASRRRSSAGPSVSWAAAPVVIVPPGPLHTIPWALLPALAGPRRQRRAVGDRVDAGAPRRRRCSRRRVVLVRGPGLVSEGAEIPGGGAALRRRNGAGRARTRPASRVLPAPWTAPGWRTSPRTAISAPTARCSPPCACTTGR